MALDAVASDAATLFDITQQVHQRCQLRFGKRVAPVAIVDEFDGDGAAAVVPHMMRYLVLGHAGAHCPVSIDHVMDTESGVRFDLPHVLFERASFHPDGFTGLRITGRAARGVDDDHVYGLSADATCAPGFGITG